MRTQKRWTNVTFTRRVDREAGRHRGPRAAPGTRTCSACGAVYAKRRWSAAPTPSWRALGEPAEQTHVLCPACQQIVSGQFSGELRISGAFPRAHRAEIERLIRNEVRRAASENPLGRIVRMDTLPDGRLRVRTTTEHLAKRLGHALRKAFQGTARYRFSEENKFAHVFWSRDTLPD